MVSAQCLVRGGVLGASPGVRPHTVVLTIQDDGVSIFDLNTKAVMHSWALGQETHEFSAPAVYESSCRCYFVAVQGRTGSTLLTWRDDEAGKPLSQIATRIPLSSSAAAVLPLTGVPVRRRNTEPMVMDSSNSGKPAVFVAHSNGTVTLSSTSGVLFECTEALGSPLLSASVRNGILYTVHTVRDTTSQSILLGRFAVVNEKIRCESLQRLPIPFDGQNDVENHPIAAMVTSSGRGLVLCSDGAVAGFNTGDVTQAEPYFVRRIKTCNFAFNDVVVAAGGKTPGRRKRNAGNGLGDVVTPMATFVESGDGIALLVCWEKSSTPSLRVIALDAVYGAILSTSTLSARDLGIIDAAPDIQGRLQGCSFHRSKGQIALVAGGAACLVDVALQPPTLANLVGALNINATEGRHQSQQLQPSMVRETLPDAAVAVLREEDLAQLATPQTTTAGPLTYQITLLSKASPQGMAPTQNDIVVPGKLKWSFEAPHGMAAVERAAWAKLVEARMGKKRFTEPAYLSIVQPLIQRVQKEHTLISYEFLCKLLLIAAENGFWSALDTILEIQRPVSLAGCRGVARALAAQERHEALRVLLLGATDMDSSELLAVLQLLLAPAEKGSAKDTARRKHASKLRSIAEQYVTAAEKASHHNPPQVDIRLVSTAACAAGAVDGFSNAQLCLHSLLAQKHDASIVAAAVSRLSVLEARDFLRYLQRWLHNYRVIIGEAELGIEGALGPITLPGLEAVVRWVGLTLDGSTARLLLRPETAAFVADLQLEVIPQVAALKRLVSVKGVIEHLQCGAPLPGGTRISSTAGRYTMEWLSLHVT